MQRMFCCPFVTIIQLQAAVSLQHLQCKYNFLCHVLIFSYSSSFYIFNHHYHFMQVNGQDVRTPVCSHSFLLNLVPAFSSLLYILYYLTMVATYLLSLHFNSDALLSSLSLTILLTLQSLLF